MADSTFIRMIAERVLSQAWGKLDRYEFDFRRRDGTWQRQVREVYDRGNGAVCLPYDPDTGCVLLIRQFRLPAFLNHGETGLIEAPAGMLDGADPARRMRAELIEETGFQVDRLEHLYDVYMSPGSVTETLSCFVGIYSGANPVAEGGGKPEEGEDIEVLHIPLGKAAEMILQGEIRDAKTIMLIQHLTLHGVPDGAGG